MFREDAEDYLGIDAVVEMDDAIPEAEDRTETRLCAHGKVAGFLEEDQKVAAGVGNAEAALSDHQAPEVDERLDTGLEAMERAVEVAEVGGELVVRALGDLGELLQIVAKQGELRVNRFGGHRASSQCMKPLNAWERAISHVGRKSK